MVDNNTATGMTVFSSAQVQIPLWSIITYEAFVSTYANARSNSSMVDNNHGKGDPQWWCPGSSNSSMVDNNLMEKLPDKS